MLEKFNPFKGRKAPFEAKKSTNQVAGVGNTVNLQEFEFPSYYGGTFPDAQKKENQYHQAQLERLLRLRNERRYEKKLDGVENARVLLDRTIVALTSALNNQGIHDIAPLREFEQAKITKRKEVTIIYSK